MIVLFFTPLDQDSFSPSDTYPSLPAFRFSFIFTLIILSVAVLIIIFRKYRINYIVMLELDMSYRIR